MTGVSAAAAAAHIDMDSYRKQGLFSTKKDAIFFSWSRRKQRQQEQHQMNKLTTSQQEEIHPIKLKSIKYNKNINNNYSTSKTKRTSFLVPFKSFSLLQKRNTTQELLDAKNRSDHRHHKKVTHQQQQRQQKVEKIAKKNRRRNHSHIHRHISTIQNPQDYLDHVLSSRGYPIERYISLGCAYYQEATMFQKACYGKVLQKMLQNPCTQRLRNMYEVGLHLNPYDIDTGEYFIHQVCSFHHHDLLKCIIEYGTKDIIQIADVCGRTPLHAICMNHSPKRSKNNAIGSISVTTASSPSLLDANNDISKTLQLLLECDPFLFYITDCRNATPLSFVPKQLYHQYIGWIDRYCDTIWPKPTNTSTPIQPSLRIHEKPHTKRWKRVLHRSLTPELASLLSSGKLEYDEIQTLYYTGGNDAMNDEMMEDDAGSYSDYNHYTVEKMSSNSPQNIVRIMTPLQQEAESATEDITIDDDITRCTMDESNLTTDALDEVLNEIQKMLEVDNALYDDDDDDDDDDGEHSFNQAEMEEILQSFLL